MIRSNNGVEVLEIKTAHGAIYPVLVWDESDVVLIDTGYPGQIEFLQKAIEKVGFKITDLTKIIITHQDIDHIGGLNDLLAINPKIEVLAHVIEAAYLNGEKTQIKIADMEKEEHLDERRKAFYLRLKQFFDNFKVTVNKFLVDNEVLPIAGGIEVIHTPGHTPGHICLLLHKDHILISGDALNLENGMLLGANPYYTHDMKEADESLKKLLNYKINKIVVYHGGRYSGNPVIEKEQ